MRLLTSHHLRAAGVVHAFTTRAGGVSRGVWAGLNLGRGAADDPRAVEANRARVLAALGVRGWAHVEAAQVHGDAVAVVGRADDGRVIPDADGLATAEPGVVLAVHAADCVPLLLADPRVPAVAAVHAGWRGIAAGVAVRAVLVLADAFGCRPEDLRAALGPAIGPCHYEVDEPVVARLRRWPWWEEVLTPTRPGHWRMDLWGAVRRQLADAGVPAAQVETLAWCTYEHPELFYSHRRDGTTGRHAALIALPPSPGGRRAALSSRA